MPYPGGALSGDGEARRADLATALSLKDWPRACTALVAVVFGDEDWQWLQQKCLDLLDHEDEALRGLAVACLGHVARIHGRLDRATVLPALDSASQDLRLAGRVADALDNIARYAPPPMSEG